MERNILNSSNAKKGTVVITNEKIVVKNQSKPELVITDAEILAAIIKEKESEEIIKILFDEYTLTVGEVAALFNISYTRANKWFKDVATSSKKAGRRNSSYGKHFSEERKQNIRKSLKGKPATSTYERTPEIKHKISQGLKKYFKDHPQDPTPHIENWKKGKYDCVNFGHGIAGHVYSFKNKTTFFFRSLLELKYLLMLEEDDSVSFYDYESLRIECDNGHIYTPDFLVNGNLVIELKSWKYIYAQKGEIQKQFEYKVSQGKNYCEQHNLTYKVVWDKEIDFDSSRMKHYLIDNPDIVEKYQISFLQPERVFGH